MNNTTKMTLTNTILSLAEETSSIRNCIKHRTSNIISVSRGNFLLNKTRPVALYTKEQPNGFIYNSEENCSVVLRVIDGHLLNKEDKPDVYSWNLNKTRKAIENGTKIGFRNYDENCALLEMLSTISEKVERQMLFELIKDDGLHDYFIVETPEENRRCIEITEELYNKGLTRCIDEWVESDEDGNFVYTELEIGDFLIVTDIGVYCARGEEFLATHKII
jgi:hypothetical protein